MKEPVSTQPIEFLRYFDVSAARTEEQRTRVARLRHQVFCEELGLEPTVPSGLETDHYDALALHGLITHRGSGTTAACMRLVRAGDHSLLELEENCLRSLHLGYLERLNWHRDLAMELSRLAVDPEFRRQRDVPPGSEITRGRVHTLDEEQHTFHLIWPALLFAAIVLAENAGRKHLYTMLDPTLYRTLRRAGIDLEQAGDFTQYQGQRAAFFISATDAIAQLELPLRELFDAIKTRIDAAANAEQAATG